MSISLSTANQSLGLIISLIAMQVTNRPFMKEPQLVMGIRIAFAISLICQLLASLYIKKQIRAKGEKTIFKYKAEPSFFNANDMGEIETTYQEYDMNEVDKSIRNCLLQGLSLSFASYKWGVLQPILLQSTSFLRNLYFDPLYRAYIFGMAIERPFEKNMLFGTPSNVEEQHAEDVVEDVTEEKSHTEEKKRRKED